MKVGLLASSIIVASFYSQASIAKPCTKKISDAKQQEYTFAIQQFAKDYPQKSAEYGADLSTKQMKWMGESKKPCEMLDKAMADIEKVKSKM